jgi:glyoxylase-like metal-dependent hydrolase (beta-lactamase superfamily II)
MTRSRSCLTVSLLLVLAILVVGNSISLFSAQQNQPGGDAVRIFEVRPNIHMISGAGGNIAVQIGVDGVVIVDTGSQETAGSALAAIRKLTDQPIRYIINTGPDVDHIGGNETIAKAGESIFAPNAPGGAAGPGIAAAISNAGAASIVGPETLLARMSAPDSPLRLPVVAWPTETFTRKVKDLFLNREPIQIIYQPAAHSDSDSIVMFRRSDVIVTGDVFDITRFPMIDIDKGGSIQGEIDALNRLIELTVPSIPMPWLEDGGTRVIPGHGRPCEEAELVEYRDMVTIIRDRVRDMIKRGMTLDQIKTANPTQGYRARYGADSGPWSTNMFVEAVYRSLMAGSRP